jgi:hypothetical protein
MNAFSRAVCSVVLGFLVLVPLPGQQKSPAPPKPIVAKPQAQPPVEKPKPPAAKLPPSNEPIEKRRERMKQRDGEIDRILKGKQHPER